jgi:hypothetical protein
VSSRHHDNRRTGTGAGAGDDVMSMRSAVAVIP